MNKIEFTKAMTYLGVIYGKELSKEHLSICYEYFMDVDENAFKRAIKRIVVKSKFFPTVSELVELSADEQSKEKYDILDLMYKDGYFKYGVIGELEAEQESRNYDKATMFLSSGVIPYWLLEDMKKYGYKVPKAYITAKEKTNTPLLLG